MRWSRLGAWVWALALGAAVPLAAGGERPPPAVDVVLRELSVAGALDEGPARAAVEKGLPAAERCYRRALEKNAALSGEVALRLLVGAKGRVVGATVERSSARDEALEGCVRSRAMDLRLPRLPGKEHATLRYALDFGDPARRVGILKLLSWVPVVELSGAPGDLAAGAGVSARGRLDAPEPAGVGGLGLRGTGGGGGGTGGGRIGLVGSGGEGSGSVRIPLGSVRLESPEVRGSRPAKAIEDVVHRRRNQIRYCHAREMPATPALAGRLSVRFTIAPEGTVPHVEVVSSTVGSPRLEACVTGIFRRMAFPAGPPGLVVVTYPLSFGSP